MNVVASPLSSKPRSWKNLANPPIAPFGPSVLRRDRIPAVERWAEHTRRHPASLKVTRRHMLDAAATRWDPVDGSVDAVICWENMLTAEVT